MKNKKVKLNISLSSADLDIKSYTDLSVVDALEAYHAQLESAQDNVWAVTNFVNNHIEQHGSGFTLSADKLGVYLSGPEYLMDELIESELAIGET